MQTILSTLIPNTLINLQRDSPHWLLSRTNRDPNLQSPRQVHPIFYGCYDWHSAVHSHWQVIRALRLLPSAPFAVDAIALLDQSFTPENVAGELVYLRANPTFEIPYGMAWLLQLMHELREWDHRDARRWQEILVPLEEYAARSAHRYLDQLSTPNRTGLHNQSAFSLGLMWDWAQSANEQELASQINARATHFFSNAFASPLNSEPSPVDFLSPILATADLMRRLLTPDEFSSWLWRYLGPDCVARLAHELAPVTVTSFSDGQLAHFTGLNLSRSWMLEGIASALPADDVRRRVLNTLAEQHQQVGLPDAMHPDYMVSHWAPSFAIYALTRRGVHES